MPNDPGSDYGPDGHGYYEPYDDLCYCPICGSCTEWEQCWQCHGEGGFHDCGEDCCPCLDKEEITVDCEVCHGEGGYRVCFTPSRHPAAVPITPASGGES